MERIPAIIAITNVEVGDFLANLGRVRHVGRVGVFVVTTLLVQQPSLASGVIDTVPRDYTWHESTEVVALVTPERAFEPLAVQS